MNRGGKLRSENQPLGSERSFNAAQEIKLVPQFNEDEVDK